MLASALTEGCLLDPAAGLFHCLQPALDYVEGVEDGDGVLEARRGSRWSSPETGHVVRP